MLQHTLKIGLIVVVLGFSVQDANAFGHHGWGCGYGGWGYGCYGGWGCGCYGGWGYGGWGYGGYLVGAGGYSSPGVPSTGIALTVSVPADAKVFVNDHPTRSTGERRQYTSIGLQPGAVYPYRVRAEFVRDGKPVSEEKTVQLTAGQAGSLAFSAAPNAQMADKATSTSH